MDDERFATQLRALGVAFVAPGGGGGEAGAAAGATGAAGAAGAAPSPLPALPTLREPHASVRALTCSSSIT